MDSVNGAVVVRFGMQDAPHPSLSPVQTLSARSNTIPARYLAGLLGIACGALCFAMGRYTLPIAAWLGGAALLRYTRSARKGWVLFPTWAALFLAWQFQFFGMVPLPWFGVLALGLGGCLLGSLPLFLDRWVNRRTRAFAATLVFPCAMAGADFLVSMTSPYGSWCTWGYSQYGNLPLMQLASIIGLAGITFMVFWFGAVVNWAWEHAFAWREIRRGLLIFSAAIAGVYGFGWARLLWDQPTAEYQRVAGIADRIPWKFPSQEVAKRFWSGQPLTADELTAVKADLAQRHDRWLAQSEREAKAGARLIFWSESLAWVLRADEAALIGKAAEIARRNQVYLGLALCVFDPAQSKLRQNKLVLLGPDGSVRFEYWKARPVPGPEKATTEVNGNPMRFDDTPFGRIGAFICFDLDFPALIQQAGRARTDLVIAPAGDWAEIDPWHARMAVFRAVENGFNLVRSVSFGRSQAVDCLGRTLAETDFFTNPSKAIVAEVPTRGVCTLYSRIGDTFAWVCIGALAGLVIWVGRKRFQ